MLSMHDSLHWSNVFGRRGLKTDNTDSFFKAASDDEEARAARVRIGRRMQLKDYIELARSAGIVISPRDCKGWHEINPSLYSSDQVEDVQTQTTPVGAPTLPPRPYHPLLSKGPEWTDTEWRRHMEIGDAGKTRGRAGNRKSAPCY